jgi:NAD(P)-dependent dehydrogenase (short-subunit alcohol dehydrogenase family)
MSTKIDLNGRVAVITGGARGIGYATAERFLASGAAVAIWDMNTERASASAAKLSELGVCTAHTVELTDEASVQAATAETLKTHGKIDIAVNNAGITGGNGTTWELDPKVWFDVINVNLYGPYLVCRALVPHMIAAGYGRIVNIASVAGKEGNPNASHYSASKAGLIGLTKSLGKELAQKNIMVNCVTPAASKTEQFDQMTQQHIDYMLSKIPMGRFVLPEEIAAMITWLASEECSFTTGGVFDITGGRSVY